MPHLDPIIDHWMTAVQRLGWPLSDYGNLEAQYGATVLQCTQSATNWTRQTTAAAYVEVNIGRPNLHVLLHAHVTRVLFDETASTPTAVGVEFVRPEDPNNGLANQRYTVSARREVILSAGAINSPQILMLSGRVLLFFYQAEAIISLVKNKKKLLQTNCGVFVLQHIFLQHIFFAFLPKSLNAAT